MTLYALDADHVSQDLRIAAIAPADSSMFVTLNYSDSNKIPGLILDDWTT